MSVGWNGRAGALGARGAGPLRRPPTEGLSATGGVGPAGRCRGPGPSGLLASRLPAREADFDTDQSRSVYLVRLISIWHCSWLMLRRLFMTLDMPDEGTR